MSFAYYKRYRMDISLRGKTLLMAPLPEGYRYVSWNTDLVIAHAETKCHSFEEELDAVIFPCLGNFKGCRKLMTQISYRTGFLPETTWLIEYYGAGKEKTEYCGTIQGIKADSRVGSIQNIGVTPHHRRRGLAKCLLSAALLGFQQAGLSRVFLQVTAQNEHVVRMYEQYGFRRTKTLFKAVDLAYSEI